MPTENRITAQMLYFLKYLTTSEVELEQFYDDNSFRHPILKRSDQQIHSAMYMYLYKV